MAAVGYHPRWSPMRFLVPGWARGRASGRWLALERFLLDGQADGGLVGSLDDAARSLRMQVADGAIDGRVVRLALDAAGP